MAGSTKIQSSTAETEAVASQITLSADQLDLKLKNEDVNTTIPANGKSKQAFFDASATMKAFSDQLAVEANNIKTIGLEFEELDKLCADLNANIGK